MRDRLGGGTSLMLGMVAQTARGGCPGCRQQIAGICSAVPIRMRGEIMTGTAEGAVVNTEQGREILNVKGAAKILGCSAAHLSNILNGKVDGVPPIPHVRAGRLRLIRREA